MRDLRLLRFLTAKGALIFPACLLSQTALTLGAPFCPPAPHLLIFVVQILPTYYYRIPITYRCYLENVKLVKYPPAAENIAQKQKGIHTCRVCTCYQLSRDGINAFSFLPFRPFSTALVAESFSPIIPCLLLPTCSSAIFHIPPWLLKDCQVGKH